MKEGRKEEKGKRKRKKKKTKKKDKIIETDDDPMFAQSIVRCRDGASSSAQAHNFIWGFFPAADQVSSREAVRRSREAQDWRKHRENVLRKQRRTKTKKRSCSGRRVLQPPES